jgi:hypothetical protein
MTTVLCRELNFRISASDPRPLDVEALDRAFEGRDVLQRMRARTASGNADSFRLDF